MMQHTTPSTQQIETALRLVLGPGFESRHDEYDVAFMVMRGLARLVKGDGTSLRYAFAALLMNSEDNDAAELADEIGAAWNDALRTRAAAGDE